MRRIREIMRKEFIQLRRDRRLLPMLFMAPVIQLLFLGYAATTDLKNVPVVVCDLSKSADSRSLVAAFSAGGHFLAYSYVDHPNEMDRYLDENRADLGIVIPADFAVRLASGDGTSVQVLVDGSLTNATIALGQMASAIGQHAQGIVTERFVRTGRTIHRPEVLAQTRVWYNPDLTSRNFMVPAVLALILMVITTIVTSMAIVREKESGTIEQIVVTPIRPWQLIIGKLLPFAIVGFIEVLLVLSVTVFWFRVPLRGNVILLLSLCVLFLLNTQGLGLFVSTVSHTQQQAMMTAVFFIMIPMILLSGFAFPIEDMPMSIQYLTYLMPLRYFLVIVRGIFLKGVGLDVLWPQVVALGTFGTIILTLAALRFQKRVG